MKRFTILAALTLFTACTAPPVSPVAAAAVAAQPPAAAATNVLASLSPAVLDAFISRTVADQHAIGVTVGVMQDGKVVFSKGYGLANTQTKTPVTPETLFAVGSVTKQFTGRRKKSSPPSRRVRSTSRRARATRTATPGTCCSVMSRRW